eukprot:CAMPEP_0168315610 /NCGR_PEP_ID=MMETSP0210-20121227/11928_1 /TAXON_ID=40633 /ORGANISM="Condylostoma magnum, Strain COL2" /LENGTH=122 /DNA_ID=CAMNT_0008289969 /DNA_START=1535 /DNA_END=1903 /DNA_ORIENTATION=+
MSAGDFAIWIVQLVIIFPAPIFVGYWVLHENWTFYGENTDYITSATIAAALAIIPSGFLAQLFANFLRGLIHGTILSYMCEFELYPEKEAKWKEAYDVLDHGDVSNEFFDDNHYVPPKQTNI